MTGRRGWGVVLGAVLVIGLAWFLTQWRALSGEALSAAARAEVLRVSDSVYVLEISPIRFRFAPFAIAFDSAYVTTDDARRAAFPNRAALRISLRDCQLSGVAGWRLFRRQGLHGQLLRCATVQAGATLGPAAARPRDDADKRRHFTFLTLQREFRLPDAVPLIAIEDVEFPDIRLEVDHPETKAPPNQVSLQKFSVHLHGVVMDPHEPVAERRPLFSEQVSIAVEGLALGSGDQTVTVRHVSTDLIQGSITVAGLAVEPSAPAREWLARQRFRRPWIKLALDSIRFTGVDLSQLFLASTISADQAVIDGLHASIETDASLPRRPASAGPGTSPVSEAAGTAAMGYSVDVTSLRLDGGSARYVGRRPGHPATIIDLPQVSLESDSVAVNQVAPADRERRPLTKSTRLNLDGASYSTGDSLKSLTVGEFRLNTGDSTLVARRIAMGPSLGDSAWSRHQRFRSLLGRASIDSVVLRGVDYDRLVTHGAVSAGAVTVGGAQVRLMEDMALPAAPRPARLPRASRPALDSTLADFGVATRIGRLRVDGTVTYTERRAGQPDHLTRVRALALDGVAIGFGEAGGRPTAPLLSQRLTFSLSGVTWQSGSVRSLAVGQVEANFGDSTLVIDSIRLGPTDATPQRRTTVRAALDSVRLASVDFVGLADGRGARVGQAIFGHAVVAVLVDGTVASSPSISASAAAASAAAPNGAAFSGFSFPIEIGELRLMRGEGSYSVRQPGRAPFVVSLNRFSVAGRALALERGVTRPLLTQDVQISASGLRVADAQLTGSVDSAAVSIGDSTLTLTGIQALSGAEPGTPRTESPAADGMTITAGILRLTGVDFESLARGRAVHLRQALLDGLDVEVRRTAAEPSAAPPKRDTPSKGGMPFVIGELDVPNARLRVVQQRPGQPTRISTVKRASLSAGGITFDPGAPREEQLAHVSRTATLSATEISLDDDPMHVFAIGALSASMADSTIRVSDLRIGPTVSDSLWVSRQDHRRSRFNVNADSVRVAGLDPGRLLADKGVWLRAAEVFGLDLGVYSDKNLPADSIAKRHSSVQQDVQSIRLPFGVDSLLVRGGQVVYRERDVGKPAPGVVPFTDVTATITGFTSRGLPGVSPPLRVAVQATLFGAAALEISAEAPLTAAEYDVSYHGRVGPMPATAINMMVERALPVKLEGGQFEEVTFAIESKNGVATGTVVPVYHGLKLKLTDPSGSLLKRAEFSVVNFAAKEFLIRHDNPGKESEPPRTGTVDHVFAGETVVDFLWYALRGGLEKVMLK